jgi:hypothetical protein
MQNFQIAGITLREASSNKQARFAHARVLAHTFHSSVTLHNLYQLLSVTLNLTSPAAVN